MLRWGPLPCAPHIKGGGEGGQSVCDSTYGNAATCTCVKRGRGRHVGTGSSRSICRGSIVNRLWGSMHMQGGRTPPVERALKTPNTRAHLRISLKIPARHHMRQGTSQPAGQCFELARSMYTQVHMDSRIKLANPGMNKAHTNQPESWPNSSTELHTQLRRLANSKVLMSTHNQQASQHNSGA